VRVLRNEDGALVRGMGGSRLRRDDASARGHGDALAQLLR
jgi:hypothetical protein